jgi:hypothetical protein
MALEVADRDARSAGMANALFGAASIKERITGVATRSREVAGGSDDRHARE